MDKKNFNTAEFLYRKRVSEEKEPENPDDVTLSVKNMLSEIKALGYAEYEHLADVKLRSITSKKIMAVLVKYYGEMDRYTRDAFMYKINPKYFPEIVPIAKEEFLALSPSERRVLRGFQYALGRAEFSEEYCEEMAKLLDDAELYSGLGDVRKALAKKCSQKILPFIYKYGNCLLALDVIQDCKYLSDKTEAVKILEHFGTIQDDEAENLRKKENNRLSVTNYEYYLNICTAERLRSDAKKILKEI